MNMAIFPLTTALFLLPFVPVSDSSAGDASPEQFQCVSNCIRNHCQSDNALLAFSLEQPWYEAALQWSCDDNCEYKCMWRTINAFQRAGKAIPQFRGKWPFIRVFGLQV